MSIKLIKNIPLFFSFEAVLSGCVEPFNYHPESRDTTLLVVDGGITNLQEKQYLHLSWTSAYGSKSLESESVDLVRILENGKAVDTCYLTWPGTYQIDGDKIKAKPGNQYSVEITTWNGQLYRSDPETMPYPVKPDSAYIEMGNAKRPNAEGDLVIDSWQINLYIDTPVRTEKSYAFLRWQVFEAYSFREYYNGSPLSAPHYCFIDKGADNQNIELFDGQNLSGGELTHHLLETKFPQPNYEFYYLHYFNISQYSISKEAYEYWTQLKSVANPSGSFLDTPPAAVIGNVHNVNNKDEIVLGYFEVAAENIIRVRCTRATVLPYYVHDPCSDYPMPGYCGNCLSLPNSSFDFPPYW